MALQAHRRPALAILAVLSLTATDGCRRAQEAGACKPPTIPKVWDDDAIASLELPLVDPTRSPRLPLAGYYDAIPVRKIYKGYPVYRGDTQPPGYIEQLRGRKPEEIVF